MIKSFIHFSVFKTIAAAFLAMMVGYLLLASGLIFIVLSACFCIRQTFMSSLRHFVDELSNNYSEKFYRMCTYYLQMTAGSFRARKNNVW